MTALYGNVTITDRIMTKAGLSRDSPVIDILFEAHQKIIGGDSITPCSILSRITIIIDRIMTKAGLIRDSPVIRIVFI
jgi:hypothetical protein